MTSIVIEGMDDLTNVLYYGDNLEILRRYVKDESVDLIYLDLPFKSDQNYNVLFKGAGQDAGRIGTENTASYAGQSNYC